MVNKLKLAYFVEKDNAPSETFIAKEIAEFRSYGAEIDVYPLIKKYKPTYYLRVNKLKKLKYDAVIAHFFSAPAREAYRCFKNSDIPLIISCHAQDVFVENMNEKLQNNILSRADKIVTCCKGNLECLKGKFPGFESKMELYYHGVKLFDNTLPKHYFLRDNKLRLLFAGRLVEKKGLAEFINLLGSIREKLDREVELTIVGDGKEKIEIIRAISANNMNDMVNILPFCAQEELKKHYLSADMFVFPSIIAQNGDRDGLANVILEAFSHGLPVLATAVNGTIDAVKDGESGFIMDYYAPYSLLDLLNSVTPEELNNVAKVAFLNASTKFNHETCLRLFYDSLNTSVFG